MAGPGMARSDIEFASKLAIREFRHYLRAWPWLVGFAALNTLAQLLQVWLFITLSLDYRCVNLLLHFVTVPWFSLIISAFAGSLSISRERSNAACTAMLVACPVARTPLFLAKLLPVWAFCFLCVWLTEAFFVLGWDGGLFVRYGSLLDLLTVHTWVLRTSEASASVRLLLRLVTSCAFVALLPILMCWFQMAGRNTFGRFIQAGNSGITIGIIMGDMRVALCADPNFLRVTLDCAAWHSVCLWCANYWFFFAAAALLLCIYIADRFALVLCPEEPVT